MIIGLQLCVGDLCDYPLTDLDAHSFALLRKPFIIDRLPTAVSAALWEQARKHVALIQATSGT
jgi:hypothetical protein